MGAKFFNAEGAIQDVEIPATLYSQASAANLSVAAFINNQYPTDVERFGTTFNQMLSASGLLVPDQKLQKNYGLRAPTMEQVLSGGVNFSAGSNSQQFGNAAPSTGTSRTLFPAALIAYMETALVKNYDMDANVFDRMVATEISVDADRFEQPQINMSTPNGPNVALASRRAQLAGPASMMQFTTSDKTRKIPTYALGMEFSKEALRATTLDLVGMSVSRQMMVERDSWVNSYISDFYAGDLDINTGSLASLSLTVNTSALDATSTTTITQKAWLKWLFRNRKLRVIDWVMCDLATYLLIEGRTGRPSLTAIDNGFPRLEAQARIQNGVIGDVNVFIVDDATAGGPLPAGTILGVDSRYGIARVRNTSANVTAAEQYALRQAEAFSLQFGEICYRLHDDAFDTLVVA
jgi:hypothetical protein